MRELSPDWQRRLDDWNDKHTDHPPVVVRWNEQAVKKRVIKWVVGVSVPRWEYEGRWEVGVAIRDPQPSIKRACRYMTGSGLWFFKLFTWMNQATKEFLELDERIFECLGAGDMTRPGFRKQFLGLSPEEEEIQDLAEEQGIIQRETAEVAYGAKSHYLGYDNPSVSMNPEVKAGAKWRWRTR